MIDPKIEPELLQLAKELFSEDIGDLLTFEFYPDACACMGPATGDVLCACHKMQALEENAECIVETLKETE